MHIRVLHNLIRTASFLDQTGRHEEADAIDRVLCRLADVTGGDLDQNPGLALTGKQSNMLQRGYGIGQYGRNQPLQAQQSARWNPQTGKWEDHAYGGGPNDPLQGPQYKPGMNAEQLAAEQSRWNNDPRTREWMQYYNQQGQQAAQWYGQYPMMEANGQDVDQQAAGEFNMMGASPYSANTTLTPPPAGSTFQQMPANLQPYGNTNMNAGQYQNQIMGPR